MWTTLLLLPLATAAAAPPPCASPEQWRRAVHGEPLLPVLRSARMGVVPDGPPPPSKTVYGGHFSHHRDTANFSINWEDGSIDPAVVEATAEALELGWQSFIEDQGWPAPVSSEDWLLWVVLDPALSGTGLTNEYTTDEYPDGYPVIWVDPDGFAEFGPAFYTSLVVHELMHAVQFAMRPSAWEADDMRQAWYWEASATHAAELADPTVDGHQYTSAWYVDTAEARFDTVNSAHEYGMFVFNAWLEQDRGPGAMQEVWESAAARPATTPWDELLAEATGTEAAELWAGFTGAYGNGLLAESALFTAVRPGALELPLEGTADALGTRYYIAGDDLRVTLTAGEAVLGGPTGAAEVVELARGEVLAVTSLVDGGSFTVDVAPDEPVDSGGGGDGADGGGDDGDGDGDEDTDSDNTPDDSDGGTASGAGATTADPGKSSGCSTAGATPGRSALALLALVLPLAGRRRPSAHDTAAG